MEANYLGVYMEVDNDMEEKQLFIRADNTYDARNKLEKYLEVNKIKAKMYGVIPFSTIETI